MACGNTGKGKREEVREHYGQVARDSACEGQQAQSSCSCSISGNAALYDAQDIAELPLEVLCASRGCADPHTLAAIQPGQTVLDLGSGGGIDAFIAAREVGSTGKVIGLDMTQEMIDLATAARDKAGFTNVEFIQGFIEDIPLPDASVDVVISNCVINLSTQKDRVLAEAFRILKPGGRFAVADIAAVREIDAANLAAACKFLGCRSGVMLQREYEQLLLDLGFRSVQMIPASVYSACGMKARAARKGGDYPTMLAQMDLDRIDGAFASMLISAKKVRETAASSIGQSPAS